MKLYLIRSHRNCNSLGGVWADSEDDALTRFHEEMAPVVLDVYASEVEAAGRWHRPHPRTRGPSGSR